MLYGAIIPHGSFKLPEGYQFGSLVAYNSTIDVSTKPLRLHLPHGYSDKDTVRDGLSLALAPQPSRKGKSISL